MHRYRIRPLGALLLLAAGTTQAFDRAAVERGVQAMAPDARITELRDSPVDGWVEVVLGTQIVYVSADGKHLLSGSLYATANREDLSERSKSALRAGVLKTLPPEALISFEPATATHRVKVFTALDCGFCKQLHQQLASYMGKGIAIDYVLIPRSPEGTPAELATRGLHCADNPAVAFNDAVLGLASVPTDAAMCPAKGYEAGKTLAQQLGISSTPTFVFDDGSINPGYLSADDLQVRLDAIAAR